MYIHIYIYTHIYFYIIMLIYKIYLFIYGLCITHSCVLVVCLKYYLYKDARSQFFIVQFCYTFVLLFDRTDLTVWFRYFLHSWHQVRVYLFFKFPHHLYISTYLHILKCSQYEIIKFLMISTLDEFLDSSFLKSCHLKVLVIWPINKEKNNFGT